MKLKLFLLSIIISVCQIYCRSKGEIFLDQRFDTGFINISPESDMFYWFFPSLSSPESDPLVFWLTGGPGCSSILALFHENGPFKIKEDLKLEFNQYSWSNASNLVFVDQPVGTGYSNAKKKKDLVHNEDQVAQEFLIFLEGFLQKHYEFQHREIFITGESYAGHYIPAIGAEMIRQKKNLLGIAIGNGWVDARRQFPQYATFAYENKLINKKQYKQYNNTFDMCIKYIKENKFYQALFICNMAENTIVTGGGKTPRFNYYDIRRKCDVPPMCYDFSDVKRFLEQEDVVAVLGTEDRTWKECKRTVQEELMGDYFTDMRERVEYILRNQANVLIYSGDKDFICNWRGGEAWTNAMIWKGQEQYVNQQYSLWHVDGKEVGEYKQSFNLAFIRIYNAGHIYGSYGLARGIACIIEQIYSPLDVNEKKIVKL